MSKVYSEFRFYSPIYDSECIRLSVPDANGHEFFAIVPDPGLGKSLRDLRDKALDAIEAAIDAGLSPGQVRLGGELDLG